MVRTKADGGSSGSRKAVGGNAPRKALGGASTSTADSPSGKGNKFAGGNPVCPRPTPDWQKGIGMFLSPSESKDKENAEPNEVSDSAEAGSSKDGQGTSQDSNE